MRVTREVACCCDTLRLKLSGEQVMNAGCSCVNCKRRIGRAYRWQCYFPETLVAEPVGNIRVYASEARSGRVERSFRAAGGGTVFGRAAVFLGVVGIAGSCLPNDSFVVPTAAASDQGRCAWVAFPDGVGSV